VVYNTITDVVLYNCNGCNLASEVVTTAFPTSPVYAAVSVAVNNPGGANNGNLIANATVQLTMLSALGNNLTETINTGPTGIVYVSLANYLSHATAANYGFGLWNVNAVFSAIPYSGTTPGYASSSGLTTFTVEGEDATAITIQIVNGSGAAITSVVQGGAASVDMMLTDSVLDVGLASRPLELFITGPSGFTPVQAALTTNPAGTATYALSTASMPPGAYTIYAQFLGQLSSAVPGGLAPSANFLNLSMDDPGWYYENGENAGQLRGAHGTPYIGPRMPGAIAGIDIETQLPVNEYGMISAGDVYGYNYWGVPTEPPMFNAMGDPINHYGTGFGNTYIPPEVSDRSGGVEMSVQHEQNPNRYRPNAYPGYQGDPAFNNYGNQYVDTNVTDRSQPMVLGLQEAQNNNYYRNDVNDPSFDLARYYGPILAPADPNDPLFTMWQNQPNAYAPTNQKVLETYGRPSNQSPCSMKAYTNGQPGEQFFGVEQPYPADRPYNVIGAQAPDDRLYNGYMGVGDY
jgi:hypothetical protein